MGRVKPNTIKLARQRRAWAKSLSRRGFQQPNRDIVKQYAHAARGLEDTEFVDRVADTLRIKNKEPLRQQGELEAWLPKGCDMRFRGPGVNNPFLECFTYHNSRKNCFVVIQVDITRGIELRSTTYSSKELLVMCWERDAIQWVFKRHL